MSLDVAILGDDGAPKDQVRLNVDDHYRLMLLAKSYGLTALTKMDDYYSDVRFALHDLGLLEGDALALLDQVSADERLYSFLSKLVALIDVARAEHRPICALAD